MGRPRLDGVGQLRDSAQEAAAGVSDARANHSRTGTKPRARTTSNNATRPDGRWTAELARVRLRALFALPLLALLVLGGRAEACPLTDPQCAVDQADKTVEETVNDVPEVVEEVTDPVEETVDQVEETVEDTGGDVQETVDETLDPETGGVDQPSPPTDPDNRRPGDKGDDRKGRPRDEQRDIRSRGGAWRPDDRSSRPPAGSNEPAPARLTASSQLEAPAGDGGLGESAIEAIKDFAFPLILTILVGAFLAVQHRFDRRDPKLVLAPLDHDYLSFE